MMVKPGKQLFNENLKNTFSWPGTGLWPKTKEHTSKELRWIELRIRRLVELLFLFDDIEKILLVGIAYWDTLIRDFNMSPLDGFNFSDSYKIGSVNPAELGFR
jgi:hypothetical protein